MLMVTNTRWKHNKDTKYCITILAFNLYLKLFFKWLSLQVTIYFSAYKWNNRCFEISVLTKALCLATCCEQIHDAIEYDMNDVFLAAVGLAKQRVARATFTKQNMCEMQNDARAARPVCVCFRSWTYRHSQVASPQTETKGRSRHRGCWL